MMVKIDYYGMLIVIFTRIFSAPGHISKLVGEVLDENQENQHESEENSQREGNKNTFFI
jgi:hypothetical protein